MAGRRTDRRRGGMDRYGRSPREAGGGEGEGRRWMIARETERTKTGMRIRDRRRGGRRAEGLKER